MSFIRNLIVKEATREVAKEFRKEIRTLLRMAKDRAVKKGKKIHNWYQRERTWKDELVEGGPAANDPDAQLLLEEALREEEALNNLEEEDLPRKETNKDKKEKDNAEHDAQNVDQDNENPDDKSESDPS